MPFISDFLHTIKFISRKIVFIFISFNKYVTIHSSMNFPLYRMKVSLPFPIHSKISKSSFATYVHNNNMYYVSFWNVFFPSFVINIYQKGDHKFHFPNYWIINIVNLKLLKQEYSISYQQVRICLAKRSFIIPELIFQ